MSDVCQALQSNLFYSVDSTQALSTSFCVHTEGKVKRKVCYTRKKTPSITFQHLPPNSARFGYATEGALFISTQLSTDVVSAIQKVWVLI